MVQILMPHLLHLLGLLPFLTSGACYTSTFRDAHRAFNVQLHNCYSQLANSKANVIDGFPGEPGWRSFGDYGSTPLSSSGSADELQEPNTEKARTTEQTAVQIAPW